MDMKKYILLFVASLMMVSCVDTVILPEDKTVDEDFWKSKSDVELMVNGAYHSMLSADVIKRLIVWGDLRSDELLPVSSVNSSYQGVLDDLIEINTANTQYDNQFATWGAFYSVINNCNLVLDRAAEVMQEDPSYTEGDYQAHRSQMLALRSLCYFYLVRNFRDVPYVTQAFMNSSQNFDVPQMNPEYVLLQCIKDLEEAERNAISPLAYTNWMRVGYLNRDGIDALMADIYLWLASVKNDNAYYKKSVEYCDKVIQSKQAQYRATDAGAGLADDAFPLIEGRMMFNRLFVQQNGSESIFELQFDGRNNSNTGVCEMFNKYYSSAAGPYLVAPKIFLKGAAAVWQVTGVSNYDEYRAQLYTYAADGDNVLVRKMVDNMSSFPSNAAAPQDKATTRAYDRYDQNYIIYRLTDVMLMKAEALTQIYRTDSVLKDLQDAFEIVKAINVRDRDDASLVIKWNTFSNPDAMEKLVLDERLRELAFEGKRWYDLMRYNYRQLEADQVVRYDLTLAEQESQGMAFAKTTNSMLNLVKRKLGDEGDAVAAKLRSEAHLYLPVSKTDIEVSRALRQNPVYSMDKEYEKNY